MYSTNYFEVNAMRLAMMVTLAAFRRYLRWRKSHVTFDV